MPFQDAPAVHEDGQQEFANFLDAKVASGEFTQEQAMQEAQEHGLSTGSGPGYLPPGYVDPNAATLNEQSVESQRQSAAYQASRVGNPEGYTAESQAAFNQAHPLDGYKD